MFIPHPTHNFGRFSCVGFRRRAAGLGTVIKSLHRRVGAKYLDAAQCNGGPLVDWPAKADHNDTDRWHEALHDGVVIGAAVYERSTSTIFLFYTSCYHRCSIPGSSPTTLFLKSNTLGLSWDPKPTNLTGMMVREQVFMMQFGEGLGVQYPLTGRYPNRLLVCGWYNNVSKYGFAGVVCLGSDTAGQSWRVQGKLVGPVNEVGLALLQNGSVLLNMRSAAMHRNRVQSMSHDGGSSFTAICDVPSLPDPVGNPAPPDSRCQYISSSTTGDLILSMYCFWIA